jgi:hypothetical protein
VAAKGVDAALDVDTKTVFGRAVGQGNNAIESLGGCGVLLLALSVMLLAFLFPTLLLFWIVGLEEILVGGGCSQLLTASRSVLDFPLSEVEVFVFLGLGIWARRGSFRRS